MDKVGGAQAHAADLLGAVVAVAESDPTLFEGFDPAVGDGDSENIAGEVFEHLGTGTGMLAVDDPGFAPHRSRDLILQA